MKRLVLALGLVVVAAVSTECASAAPAPSVSGPVDPNGPTVIAKDMKFQTGQVEVKAGENLTLHFDNDAVDGILQEALHLEVPALSVCQNLAEDLEHALKLVRDRTSQDCFLLTREAIDNLDAYLNQVIRDYYQKTLFRE